MKYFNDQNTEGYTPRQLMELNRELEIRLSGLEPEDDDYDFVIKSFADEISKR